MSSAGGEVNLGPYISCHAVLELNNGDTVPFTFCFQSWEHKKELLGETELPGISEITLISAEDSAEPFHASFED